MGDDSTPTIQDLMAENLRLREALAAVERNSGGASQDHHQEIMCPPTPPPHEHWDPSEKLSSRQIMRYSRQLLVPDFGVKAQTLLLSSSVLVVGAGGLGSSVLMYLAAAGVGRLGIVDMDTVHTSNLHRQVIHTEDRQGCNKAESARQAVMALNSSVHCVAYAVPFGPSNGLELTRAYDVIVDASDNPRTRYLVSDACVLAGKPLLSVYVHGGAPCYRCIHPKPFAAEAHRSCSDNGVLGPVPGLIGTLQAMEAIKVITGTGEPLAGKLLLYEALRTSFRVLKLPPRTPCCVSCGSHPTIHSLFDSEALANEHGLAGGEGPSSASCGATTAASVTELPPENEVSCEDYHSVRQSGQKHLLLDVRDPAQFEICSLEGAKNVPFNKLPSWLEEEEEEGGGILAQGTSDSGGSSSSSSSRAMYVICRRGVLSARATRLLLDRGVRGVVNVRGGLAEWHRSVDRRFPLY